MGSALRSLRGTSINKEAIEATVSQKAMYSKLSFLSVQQIMYVLKDSLLAPQMTYFGTVEHVNKTGLLGAVKQLLSLVEHLGSRK